MIGRITGTLLEKSPPVVCVDVAGVGYEIDVPMSTLYELPDTGSRVTLYTHLAVRDDAHTLYGFSTANERATFRTLIKVTGIGARTALAILSGLTVDELITAISEQETARLLRVPGIGKKTAERLLLELRDKLGSHTHATSAGAAAPKSAQHDILEALTALGYSSSESQKVLKTLPKDVEVTEGIRLALKSLGRG